jgi:hypothetical protein
MVRRRPNQMNILTGINITDDDAIAADQHQREYLMDESDQNQTFELRRIRSAAAHASFVFCACQPW